MSSITDRFLEVCELLISKGHVKNLSQLAQKANMSKSQISDIKNGRTKIGGSTIQKLLMSFPEINSEWLLTGNGNIISNSTAVPEGENDEYPNVGIQNRFISLIDGFGKSPKQMASDLNLTEKDFKIAIEPYTIKWSFILSFCSHYEINAAWLVSKEVQAVNSLVDIIKRFTDNGKQIEDLSKEDQVKLNKQIAIRQDTENRFKHWADITEQEFLLKQYHLRVDRELRKENPAAFEFLFNSRKLIALNEDLEKLLKAYVEPVINKVGNYSDYEDFKNDYIAHLQNKQVYASAIKSVVEKLQKFIEKDFAKYDTQHIAKEFAKLIKIDKAKFGGKGSEGVK